MKRTLIAAAVLAAASGTAFAHNVKNPFIYNVTGVTENVDIDGFVRLFGCVTVSSTVGAVVHNSQNVMSYATLDPTAQSYSMGQITTTLNNNDRSVTGSGYAKSSSTSSESGSREFAQSFQEASAYAYKHDSSSISGGGYEYSKQQSSSASSESHSKSHNASWAFGESVDSKNVTVTGSVTDYVNTQKPGNLTATTGAGAGSGSAGNIGMNVAEGVDNAQSNDASLASVDTGNVFGNAQIFSSQSSSGTAKVNNFMLNASLGDNSLSNVSGNLGVNIAAGVANVQNNSLAASTTNLKDGSASLAVAMIATDDNSQSAALSFQGSISGTAMIGAGALQNSTGNIGVNIAGGAGNLQHNGLAIAATNITGH